MVNYLWSQKKTDVKHWIGGEMKQGDASHINEEQAISEAIMIFDGMVIIKKLSQDLLRRTAVSLQKPS